VKRGRFSRRFVVRLLVILLATATVVQLTIHRASGAADDHAPSSSDLPLKIVGDIPLPGRATRFDYESYDPDRYLLFIAHLGDSEVIVIDTLEARIVGRIPNLSDVYGVLVVPELSRVYATATGTNEVVAIDEAGTKIVARVPGAVYPDGLAYAPDVHKLYVSDEKRATETVIDVRRNSRVATVRSVQLFDEGSSRVESA
jgi:hypothetical protein